MATTQETVKLLDKLYNLRGNDSLVIKEIEDKIKEISSLIEQTTTEKEQEEDYKNKTTEQLEKFLTQVDVFSEKLSDFDNDSFSELKAIGVNLEIGTLLSTINEKAPEYSNSLIEETKKAQENIDSKNNRINILSSERDNREEDLKEANKKRKELNYLLEQSLSTKPEDGDKENLTRKYINGILEPLGIFNEEEIYELSKIIQYPEDGLYEYDSTYKERLENGEINLNNNQENNSEEVKEEQVEEVHEEQEKVQIENVSEETTSTYNGEQAPVETEEVVKEEEQSNPFKVVDEEQIELSSNEHPTYDEKAEEESESKESEDISPVEEVETQREEEKEEVEETTPVEENKDEIETEITFRNNDTDTPTTIIDLSELNRAVDEEQENIEKSTDNEEENIKDYLVSLGLDLVKFSKNDVPTENVYELLANADKEVIKGNYEVLRSINADEAVYDYKDGYMYLTDKDLNSKLTLLRSKGISEKKITEMVLKEMAA